MKKCKLCNNEVTCHGELCEECADKNLIKMIPGIEKLGKEVKQFRREFPGLDGKDIPGGTYLHKDIQKHCLDKQKVKEVICGYIVEKVKGISFARPINPIKLLKELGL